ncbi:MAG TPA: folate-binding protein [Burkholderiales bacterium]|nr:folate-binding protein [Burkholderiales bacterium]
MQAISAMAPSSPLLDHLRRRGAHFEGDEPAHFGRPDEERAAVASGTTLHALTTEALLEVTGEDARSFLQAQLSNDVEALSATRAQLSTYCTPQGRMLASLLVWRGADAFLLQLPAELAPSIRTRLQRYVLRARVKLTDASERWAVLGVAGTQARAVLEAAFGAAPPERMGKLDSERTSVICLGRELYQVVVPADGATAQWDRLAGPARPSGSQWWRWRLIQANLPVITAATSELFVPQMANMDVLGGVNFDKGCYPGQEIVARAQYRGQVKRRLFRLHAETGAPRPGQALFAPQSAAAVGTVVNAAPAPAGGFDILAVLQEERAQRSAALCLGSEDGPGLALAP